MAIDMLVGAAQALTSSTSRIGAGTAGSLAGGAAGATSGVSSGFSQLLEGVERSASQANEAVASMVFLPVAGRLRERAAHAGRRRELITQGVCAIQKRTNPRLVAQGLRAHYADTPRLDQVVHTPVPAARRRPMTPVRMPSVPS